ncbi:hypothetical protein [Nocardioides halotolerans]|uniref:hypothetical protein n=1 Tax=Nocardioides halotolerans TaxID=433660 RepID=UPI000422E5C9|nr:hypothetical protein [Nocardioides halotolerans]
MTLTELRETLSAVSDAVPVPAPDAVAFQRHVARVRRRRAAACVIGAAAAVAAVLGGAVALQPGDRADDPVVPSHRTDRNDGRASRYPVVVAGRLAWVSDDGKIEDTGLPMAHLVGPTPAGLVAFRANGDLVRVEGGSVRRLVDVPVRTAYLQGGDQVVYEDYDGHIRWTGREITQVEGARLMAAGPSRYVVAGERGVVAHDLDGAHRLDLDDRTAVVRGIDVGGDRIAVRTESRLTIFDADGLHSGSIPTSLPGQLAPDGSIYAQPTADRRGVELLDPVSLAATPVAGPAGQVTDLRWWGADLLVVVDGRSLWRCAGGSDCSVLVSDAPAPVRLD